MIYLNSQEFWNDVLNEIKDEKTKSVLISSYGMYVGISETGENTAKKYNFDTTLQKILNEADNDKKLTVLISHNENSPCKPGCIHCVEKNSKSWARLIAHIENWSNVEWHITNEHHLKAVIIHKESGELIGFSGGRNFTNSNWRDASFRLDQGDTQILNDYLLQVIKEKSVFVNNP